MMKTTTLVIAGLIALSGPAVAQAATATPAATTAATPLADAFTKAASTYEVPRDLLVALGYAETHLDNHEGEPSASGGYGVMHLVSNPKTKALEEAAKLTSLPVAKLKTDDASNVLGGAAVLRAKADALGLDATARKDPAKWYGAVAAYGNLADDATARIYADAVYEALASGVDAAGVQTEPVQVTPDRGKYADDEPRALASSTDYPGALWKAASSANYAVSNRPTSNKIDRIIIHVTQGSYAGSISWFQNPAAKVSAHYVVRSSDGQITQMVREKNRAWHAGNSTYNQRSIGIEHEGYISDASWFTDQMYRASAALTRNIADRYGIPKDRSHIIGHVQVPGSDHTDPGSHWNWTKYMSYVTGGTGGGGATNPHTAEEVCGSGYKTIDSQALGTSGTVYLMYNSSAGKNCVATIKKTSLGKASATSAFLEVKGAARKTDTGNFDYYAGPVQAAAADKCVKWGGSVGTATYTSEFEHCG
ncbi:N-acetylmuramoyl-L-alanine amidase [Nonomuraea rhodomycinica]|uniref:N-acetylmuramoyl-L-alanine amidase n=1 Tax=Nonomuraea rhodomycinica TaxID=1712872 RepID=A0A7Y6MCU6_9ACTN|nr:N-acetylmuramoyl-L-alanine amidase [Nonomuraea rhodomycinica]NUW43758.1 N-acetylmuramoyl-L-alanine amidase [Nonomuraea rhodomycinica]